MPEQTFFLTEPAYTPPAGQRPDVARLMHARCAGVNFRRVPPKADASTLEVGRGTGGVLYIREPKGGTSQAQAWQPADGVIVCATCWNSRQMDNPSIELVSGRVSLV